jgi:hypothetical protein
MLCERGRRETSAAFCFPAELFCHSERSEESIRGIAADIGDETPIGFFAALPMNSPGLSSRGAKRRGDPARIPDGLLRRFASRNDTLIEFIDNYHPTLRRWFEVSE